MLSKITNFLDHSYARNVAFSFLIGFLCISLGSSSTALFVAASVALIFFNTKISITSIWHESRILIKQMPIVLVFPFFYFAVVLTSIRGEHRFQEVVFVAGSYWQFLVMIPASVGLFHLSKNVNFAGLFSYGCRFGLLFVVPLSLLQIYYFNLRPEGIFSNALIFASLCIVGAGVALIEWPEDDHKQRLFAWVMFVAGIVAALLTFSRGMLIPIVTISFLAALYHFKAGSSHKLSSKAVTAIGLAVIVTFGLSLQTDNGWRILNKRIIEPIQMYQNGEDMDRSIGQRLDMQRTGFHALMESPILGYGVQNAVKQANKMSESVLGRNTNYTYTHLHNDYLTHAVGGGILLLSLFILVILSPVIIAWQLRKTEGGTAMFSFGLMVSGGFSTIAMTNIVFHNDQLTTMFCAATMMIMVRNIQQIHNIDETRIPHLPTIANGINPIGKQPDLQNYK